MGTSYLLNATKNVLVKASVWRRDTYIFKQVLYYLRKSNSLGEEEIIDGLREFVHELMDSAETKERYYYALIIYNAVYSGKASIIEHNFLSYLEFVRNAFNMDLDEYVVADAIERLYQKELKYRTPEQVCWYNIDLAWCCKMVDKVSEEHREYLSRTIDRYGQEQSSYYACARFNK